MLIATALAVCSIALAAEDPKPPRPDTAGAPVYALPGTIVVFPKGVEEPPKAYKGAIGKPLAIIKLDGKVVGEVYFKPLTGTAADEAKSMAASPKGSDKMELKKQGSEKLEDEQIEFVTLKMKLPGAFGDPWIIHSVYLPRDKTSLTFKLVTSEEQFPMLLPYLETMLDPTGEGNKKQK